MFFVVFYFYCCLFFCYILVDLGRSEEFSIFILVYYIFIRDIRDVEGNGVIIIVKNLDVNGVFESEVNVVRNVDLSL